MINNLTIVGRQYDYGYDAYYVARKDESLDFPSDSAIAKAITPSVYTYTVVSKPMPVVMEVKGTLKSYVYNNYGYLSKVAKHFFVMNEDATSSSSASNTFEYELNNTPVTGTLKGKIYNSGAIIQTFTVDLGSENLMITDTEGLSVGAVKVISGSYADNVVELIWSGTPTSSKIKVEYKYESNEPTSVFTKNPPVADDYDFVTLYGNTTIDTKYVKIMSTFKCAYKDSTNATNYTNTSSRLFYTRCKSFQSLCSSKSSAYVPATIVCSERLF